MLQETANQKSTNSALESKGVSFDLDTAPEEPQLESKPLEKMRVELAIERHPNGIRTISRDDLCTLV
jgi:hypothetical protein